MNNTTSKSIITLVAFLATLYGHLNKLIPAVSGGSFISVLFILVSSTALIALLYQVAKNPKVIKKSSIEGFEIEERTYPKLQVWGSRIVIAVILLSIPFGISYNLKKMDERAIHFVTSSIMFDSDIVYLNFNISNNTGSKIFLSSFELLEYKTESLSSYDIGYDSLGNIIRHNIDLIPDSTLNGLSYIIDNGDILPFKARVYYNVYGSMRKTFGIKFRYNDLKGSTYFKGSDAIYILEGEEHPERKIRYVKYLNKDSVKSLEQKIHELKMGIKKAYELEYYQDALKIFEEHSKLLPIKNKH